MRFLLNSFFGKKSAGPVAYRSADPIGVAAIASQVYGVPMVRTDEIDGAGVTAGAYSRSAPAVYNAAFMAVGVTAQGSGIVTQSTGRDKLIQPGTF